MGEFGGGGEEGRGERREEVREGEEILGWIVVRSFKSWRKGFGKGVTKVCRWSRKYSAVGRGLRVVWDVVLGRRLRFLI